MDIIEQLQKYIETTELTNNEKEQIKKIYYQIESKELELDKKYILQKRTNKVQSRLNSEIKVECTRCDIEQLDYIQTKSYSYIISNTKNNSCQIVIIDLAHGASDPNNALWSIYINCVELCEEADLYYKSWIELCDSDNVKECEKILKSIDVDFSIINHLI